MLLLLPNKSTRSPNRPPPADDVVVATLVVVVVMATGCVRTSNESNIVPDPLLVTCWSGVTCGWLCVTPAVLLLPLLKSISNRRSVCVVLGADPLLALLPPPVTVLSLVTDVLLTVDSVAVFFCLRGVLAVPYSK